MFGNEYNQYENGISYPKSSSLIRSLSFGAAQNQPLFGDVGVKQFTGSYYESLTEPAEPLNPLYSKVLRKLSTDTEYNLRRLREKLSFIDPGYAIGIDAYYGTATYVNKVQQTVNEIHGQQPGGVWKNDDSTRLSSAPASKFCYLCTTLDEHQRHLAQRGLQLKPKHVPRPRTAYVVNTRPQTREDDDQSAIIYKVTVKTGDIDKAGTDANVFILLKGSGGAMKKQQLKRKDKKSLETYFKRGTTEHFHVTSKDLGDLTLLYIEHDGKERRHSWWLDCVIVTNEETGDSWEFPCQEWISCFHGDCNAKKKLKADWLKKSKRDYRVTTVTGDEKFAGTDSNVFITFYGRKLASSKMELVNKKKNSFERGQTDVFTVTADDVGRLQKIRIEHDNAGAAAGWFLEKVIVESLEGRKERYVFHCRQWLATNEGDRQTYKILNVKHSQDSDDEDKEYIVTVATADRKMAGTNARVFITLYGKTISSDRIELKSRKRTCFQKGAVDKFNICTDDVGQIQKIKIEHDNSGPAPGWFLDEVVVESVEDESESYVFPCGQWLSVDEGDRQTWKILKPGGAHGARGAGKKNSAHKQNLRVCGCVEYEVIVVTSDMMGAGTDANVFVTLHGTKSYSERTQLRGPGNLFERGQTDVFTVSTEDIGQIKKITLEHDNTGMSPGWHVEKVMVVNKQDSREQYTFPCRQWLAKDEGDRKTSRTLTAQGAKHADHDDSSKEYELFVTTSDIKNAGTDANVFVTLYGTKDSSNKIPLKGKGNLFEKGNTDRFIVTTDNIGALTKIRVEHDNSGMGAAWHLKQIRVVNMADDRESYVFRCDQWLAVDEGDGKLFKVLQAEKLNRTDHEGEGHHERSSRTQSPGARRKSVVDQYKTNELTEYDVTVATSDMKNAGTDANVFITLYGSKGTSDKLPLRSGRGNLFERGSVNTFPISVDNIGFINKIRIEHDNSGIGPAWHLNEVRITNSTDNSEMYVFKCDQWLSVDDGDRKTFKILQPIKSPARAESRSDSKSRPGSSSKLGLDDRRSFSRSDMTSTRSKTNSADYDVIVATSNLQNAGTDANVFITLYGNKGTSDKMALTGRGELFERGSVDTFPVTVNDIGTISKIKIEHDNSGISSAWHLKEVRVVGASSNESYLFRCDQWLSDREGDRKTFKILTADKSHSLKTDTSRDSRDNRDRLDDRARSKSPKGRQDTIDYDVIVSTSDMMNAGTDANVTLTLYGSKGMSEPLPLTGRSRNLFERGSVDTFTVTVDNIGSINKIRIEQDDSGIGSAWHLKEVRIINRENSKEMYVFACDQWLASDAGDRKTYKILQPTRTPAVSSGHEDVRRKSITGTEYKVDVYTGAEQAVTLTANVFITIHGYDDVTDKLPLKQAGKTCFQKAAKDSFTVKINKQLGQVEKIKIEHDNKGLQPNWFLEKVVLTDPDNPRNPITFTCGKWLSASKGDHKIFTVLYPSKASTGHEARPRSGHSSHGDRARDGGAMYKVQVFTGDVRNADTSAAVYLTLYGSDDMSDKLALKQAGKKCFERAQRDVFTVSVARHLGDIEKLRVEHDGKGAQPDWFLDKIIVTDQEGQSVTFECDQWLSATQGDRKTHKVLFPTSNKSHAADLSHAVRDSDQPLVYEVAVTTGNVKNAGTDARVFVSFIGRQGESTEQRLQADKASFEQGKTDVFKVQSNDVGELLAIKIRHDNTGIGAGWFLEKVTVKRFLPSHEVRERLRSLQRSQRSADNRRQSLGSGRYGNETVSKQWEEGRMPYFDDYEFVCGQWLAADEGDRQIERVIRAKTVVPYYRTATAH